MHFFLSVASKQFKQFTDLENSHKDFLNEERLISKPPLPWRVPVREKMCLGVFLHVA